MRRGVDEEHFFRATGLDLQTLIARHIGQESEDQIFEWIRMVLGRSYFRVGGTCYIHTLKGWAEYLKDTGYGTTAAAMDKNEAAPEEPS